MNKELNFIPYEEALALMKLGFDYEEYARYGERDGSVILCRKGMLCGGSFNSICTAPLFQQAFRFFREKHELNGVIDKKQGIIFFKIVDANDELLAFEAPSFKTHEDAELACLKKLIEIVKQK